MAQDILKKVTLNKLGVEKDWIIAQLKERGDEVVEVAAFVGMISDAKPRKSDLGDYILFEGDFMGVNQMTNQAVRSGAMILPGVAETPLMGMFKRAIKTDAEGNVLSQGIVEFAITITIRKDKAAIGYAYGVRNHVKTEMDKDPVLRMLKLVPLSVVAKALLLPGEVEVEEGDIAKEEGAGAPKAGGKKR